ncbi:Geraniol 8-hydroxylase [Nymphaea thermarum]|nr:Geraniol 8-hydroxylase [Nymphaea thermarum]
MRQQERRRTFINKGKLQIRLMEFAFDLLLCSFIFLLCFFGFLLFPRKINRRLPPGPVGLPFLGSLLELGDKVNESLYSLSERYGPLMTLRLGTKTVIVVSSAKMAEEVLHKHDRAFSGRSVGEAAKALDHYKHSVAWISAGPTWRELRRTCNMEVFSPKRLDALRGLREKKVEELLQHVQAASADGCAVDIGRCALVTALNIVSNTFFSKDLANLERGVAAQELKDLVGGIMETAGRPNLADFFPPLRLVDPQGVRRAMTGYFQRMHDLFDAMIDERLQASSVRTDDFFDVLLQLGGEPGSEYTMDVLKSLLMDMFVAGSDTTSSTIEWAMAELLHHPGKMAALQSELRRAIGDGRPVEEADIPQLAYLDAVVKETLRLHPPLPLLLPHRSEETVELCGYAIPGGTETIVNAWAIGRDPEVWEDPASFSPERFVGSNINYKGRDFKFIPFGAGRRICIGLPLVQRVVPLVVASLVHGFSWKLPDGMAPEQLDMDDMFGLTLKKRVPLKIVPA